MMAAIYAYAPPDHKTFALTALAFIVVFSVLTFGVHFASLTVGRQIDSRVTSLLSQQLSFGQWPTLALALDLLSRDFFLGLALLFAATVFKGDGLPKRVRVSMIVGGTLSAAGTLGPALGQLHIQYLGIAGYAFVLPVTCALLAFLFRRPS